MVVRIKKIILNFIGTGLYNNYQACVSIYDKCNNLLYYKKTYNGKLVLELKENNTYTLIAKLNNEIINTSFYTNKTNYIFIFNNSIINKSRTITFLLKDANYSNLPIEKGEIILWQK